MFKKKFKGKYVPPQQDGGGSLCPQCKFGTLRVSKFNPRQNYCSNYNAVGIMCKYKGYTKSLVVEAKDIEIEECKTLSKEQEDILYEIESSNNNILIEALAGTGKTFTLIQAIKVCNDRNLSVMYIVFGKRDKNAAVAKVGKTCLVKTSNGAGHALLSEYAKKNKLGKIKLDQYLAGNLLKAQWKKEGIIEGENWSCSKAVFMACIQLCDKARNVLPLNHKTYKMPTDDNWIDLMVRFNINIKDEEVADVLSWSTWLFSELCNLKNIKEHGIDFCNQIFLPSYYEMRPTQHYDRVMLDETQDQNYPTRKIAELYLNPHIGKFIAVGDGNQAIYEWRGADSDSMQEMEKLMAKYGNITKLPLTECRRCPVSVIEEAKHFVADIKAIPDAKLGEVRHITAESEFLEELHTKQKGLVLCRKNAPLVKYCMYLLSNGIEAQIMRSNIVTEILDLIDQCSPNNGHTEVCELLKQMDSYFSIKAAKSTNKKYLEVLGDKIKVVQTLIEKANGKIKETQDIKIYIDRLFPIEITNNEGVDVNVNDLDIKERSELCILFSSVHSAKGGEAETVYMLSPFDNEGSLWDEVWISEKEARNLSYVAITRSMNKLIYVGEKPSLNKLTEIN